MPPRPGVAFGDRQGVGQRSVTALEERGVEVADPLHGGLPRGLRIVFDAREHHQLQPLAGAVEGDHRIVEPEPGVGQTALVAAARGDGLDQPNRVVAEIAHGTATERRQIVHRRDSTEIGHPTKDIDGRPVTGRTVDQHSTVSDLDDAEGIDPGEGVAGDPLAALDALEEEGVAAAAGEPGVDGEWRHRVGGQFAHHRHDIVIARQGEKLLL